MKLVIVVALTLLLGIVAALVIFVVLYRAMSNLIDWIIYTFGNGRAVRELEQRERRRT